ncbi:response regulator [Gymnodinialimonas hymeniacidonis]|uniref:response regulator n=1 Tax=Gymnodinialimonas hymeniacidonis TaxID=3126508 RepID=UPI0034C650DF
MSMDRQGILIVEDQMLLAMDLSMSLEREGFQALGPCASVDAALEVLAEATPKAAILDVNLGSGTTSEPIAAELARRKVPFAFLTAYSRDIPIMDTFPDALFEDKPVNDMKLRKLLDGLVPSEG